MNSVRLPAFLSVLLLTALSACSDQKPATPPPAPPSTPAQTAPAHLITEGVGVAGVALGMTETEVRARLGPPNSENRDGPSVVFMSYHPTDIFGIYFDPGTHRVRMIIAAVKDRTFCTGFDVCLYRDGDLPKLLAHHGKGLLRFVDWDGSMTYRRLTTENGQQVMTEYTTNEEHQGVAQVAILYWTGRIDTSSFD